MHDTFFSWLKMIQADFKGFYGPVTTEIFYGKIFSLKMEQTNTGNEKFERERGKERERV